MAIGCTEQVQVLDAQPAPPAPDGGVRLDAQPAPDAAQDPPDAGGAPDADPPEVGPARRLTSRALFGDSPVDNRVIDPDFDLSSFHWFAFDQRSGGLAPVEKVFTQATPTRQPALRVRGARGGSPVVLGAAVASRGALEVSVWLGRDLKNVDQEPPLASVLAVGPSGAEESFDLAPDDTTRVALGGVEWTRHRALVEDLVGHLSLLIGDQGSADYYLSGALVKAAPRTLLGGAPLARARPLRAAERTGLDVRRRLEQERQDPRQRKQPAPPVLP